MTAENPVQDQQQEPLAQAGQISFWHRPLVQSVLPFGTSILLHAGILVIGLATYTAVKQASFLIRDQIIIPDATVVENADIGTPPNPGLAADSGMAADIKPDIVEQKTSEQRASMSMGLSGGTDSSDTGLIGIGSGTGSLRTGGMANGNGDATGSPFGVPGSGAPRSPFMGVSGNAYKILYVCDASGQMVTAQVLLKKELKLSIDKLSPKQSFNIIFFNQKDPVLSFRSSLVAATPANKLEAIKSDDGWIDSKYEVQMAADPFSAMHAAFEQKPELVFLLTCGLSNRKDAQIAEKLQTEIKRLNPGKKIHINTILVVPPREDQLSDKQKEQVEKERASDIEILSQIASDNGGKFKQTTID